MQYTHYASLGLLEFNLQRQKYQIIRTGRAVSPAQDGALPYRAIPGVDEEFGDGGMRVVPTQDTDSGAPAQALQEMDAAEDTWAEVRKRTGRGRDRFTVRELLADERCARAVLGFLRTTKVGSGVGSHAATGPRRPPPPPPKPGGGRRSSAGRSRGSGGAQAGVNFLCLIRS